MTTPFRDFIEKYSSFSFWEIALNGLNSLPLLSVEAGDYLKLPDPQSPRKKCTSSPKSAHTGHKIFDKPYSRYNDSTSYGPPFLPR